MKTLKTNEMAAREATTENVRVLNCTNLRAVGGGAALRPDGPPPELVTGGRMPLAICTADAGGELTVYARGSELALVSSGLATATADVGSEPLAAVADGSRLHVLTPRKHLIYNVTPEALTAEAAPRAVVRFATEADSSLAADVGAVQLSRTYSAGESAVDADSRRLSSLLAATLDRLDRDSRAAGLWWMPTLMAVRLRDSRGRTMLTTPPMLVGSADGACCDGVLELNSDDGRTTAATTLSAPAWRVKATVESLADSDLLAEVGAEQPFVERAVRWTARVRTPEGCRQGRERTLAVDMSGHAGELRVDVRRVYLDRRAPASAVALTVRGDVRSGLRRRFVARGTDFEIDISGTVGPDFLLERVSL